MEVLEEKPITKYEVLEILKEDIEKGTADSILQSTYEIIKSTSKEINLEKVNKIKEELKNLKLKEKDIVSILDFYPEDFEDLLVLFGKQVNKFEEEVQKKILEVLK
ncbi:MAG: hypothetical protein QXQ14_01130 [Candidatus Aenigmatarchaeota archaeon]